MTPIIDRSPNRDRERGAALVICIWLIVLLALPVGLLTIGVRDGVRAIENETIIDRGHITLDAALELAVMRLMMSDTKARWQPDGTSYSAALGDLRLAVTITNENARIDLNKAKPVLLAGLFEALDVSAAEAERLANRIVDWRDRNGERRAHGAEDRDYRSAGLPYGAADAPFVDTRDLARILGMPKQLATLALPHVTVFSGTATINPAQASETVLKALPGVTPGAIEQILAMRSNRGRSNRGSGPIDYARLLNAARDYVSAKAGPALRIRIVYGGSSELPDGWGEAVIMRAVDGASPYRVLSWRFRPTRRAIDYGRSD